jgi:hypothetical protein
MPDSWHDFAGRGRFRRRFGYPGRIDAHERVWLTFAGIVDCGEVTLNGTRLGECAGSGEFDVTELLRPRNELVVEVEGGVGGGLTGPVALEVRATAFLRGVVVRREHSSLIVTGEVVGHADGLLELYLIVDRRPADYATVTATAAGSDFQLRGPAVGPDGETACVAIIELVCGAMPWYTMEVDLLAGPAQGFSA